MKKNTSKISIKDILKGKFLVEEESFSIWKLVILGVFLFFTMISASHLVEVKVIKMAKNKEKLEEVKAKYALMQSKLIRLQLESKLSDEMLSDSLFALEKHPIKIVVQ